MKTTPHHIDHDDFGGLHRDLIATGEKESIPWLTTFYFGDDGLHSRVATRLDEIDPRAVGSIPIGSDESGTEVSRHFVALRGREGLLRSEFRLLTPTGSAVEDGLG